MCSGYYGPERYFVTTIVREGLSAPILQMKTLRPGEAGQMLTTRRLVVLRFESRPAESQAWAHLGVNCMNAIHMVSPLPRTGHLGHLSWGARVGGVFNNRAAGKPACSRLSI